MNDDILPRDFYARDPVKVARDLLGCVIRFDGKSGVIAEVEAYLQDGDEAAHSARGRTRRTTVLFGPPGHAYVYLSYGVHYCLNVACEPEGKAGCVLIRSVTGWGDGPGKLTKFAGITLTQNGCDLTRGPITIHRGTKRVKRIEVTPRIGIRKSAHLPLRFLLGE